MKINNVYVGDNIEVLKTFPDNSIDSVVTDPPYGLGKEPNAIEVLQSWITTGYHEVKGKGFMGKVWDAFVPQPIFWKEIYRVLKPGGYLLSFAGTRTYDWMVMAVRLAGFEIRDMIAWVYGSGFPKSHDISKAIDKMMGAERKVVGSYSGAVQNNDSVGGGFNASKGADEYGRTTVDITVPATEEAKQWNGWGTALKPALEPIVMARKPLDGTVAQNILEYGVGGINIDATRIPFGNETDSRVGTDVKRGDSLKYKYNGIDFEVLKRYENDEDYVWSENLSLSKINLDNIGEFLDGLNMVGYQFQFDLTQYEEIIIDTHLKHIIPVVDTFKNNLDSNSMFGVSGKGVQMYKNDGRFPANFIHDGSEEVEALFPQTQSGNLNVGHKRGDGTGNSFMGGGGTIQKNYGGDSGSASRFFYVAKTSQEERNFGLYDFEEKRQADRNKDDGVGGDNPRNRSNKPKKNFHPTVKPIELMRYLVRMITPPNGICLDPYLGSGTTAIACEMEKFSWIGIELMPEYAEIAKARIGAVKDYESTLDTKTIITESIKEDKEKELGIMNIFDFMEEE